MSNWSKKEEEHFKKAIKKYFDEKLKSSLRGAKNSLLVGNRLGSIFQDSADDVVRIIIPRAVRKWSSAKTFPRWKKVLADPVMTLELRMIGKSVANTMRPLAGNNFSSWVAEILNVYFVKKRMPLRAITSGVIKRDISKKLIRRKGKKGVQDYRPDIDIILIRTDLKNHPVAIISAKTTLAERVMQTITWSRYLKLPIFLVTAWEAFNTRTNRERVQELAGVYVCNKNVRRYGNIKPFSAIGRDLKKYCR